MCEKHYFTKKLRRTLFCIGGGVKMPDILLAEGAGQ